MDKKLLTGVIIIVVIVAGAIFFTMRFSQVSNIVPSLTPTRSPVLSPSPSSKPQQLPQATPTPVTKKPGVQPKPAVATITKVVLSKGITTSGAALNPANTFSPTTPATFYAVLSLKSALQRTELSYTRYYEGKYVDSKVSHPAKNGVSYFHFTWTLKPGQTRKAGNYSLNFYVNGKRAQTVNYIVQ